MNRHLALCAVLGLVGCGASDGADLFVNTSTDAGDLLEEDAATGGEDASADEAGITLDSGNDGAGLEDASAEDGGITPDSGDEDAGLDGGELDSSPDASEAGPVCLPQGASCAPPWPQFPHLDDCCYPLKCRQFAQNMYSCSQPYAYP